jgi:hypothetical protein
LPSAMTLQNLNSRVTCSVLVWYSEWDQRGFLLSFPGECQNSTLNMATAFPRFLIFGRVRLC